MLEEKLRPYYAGKTLTIDPLEIYPATGWYRTSPHADVVRWEAVVRVNGTPMGDVESWHTMTECVKGLQVKPATGAGTRAHDWTAEPT